MDDLGAELSFSQVLTPKVKISGSYSFANDPRVKREDSLFAINIPAKHKFSGALSFGGRKSSGSLEASYTDEAFWTDVLDSRYYGTTSSYFLVNARWTRELNSTMALSVSAMNLLDEDTPRHIFGDNIGRLVSAELRFRF